MNLVKGATTTTARSQKMTIEEGTAILQEVIDHLNAAYVGLVQLGNSPTFQEVRGEIVNLTTRLEDFI